MTSEQTPPKLFTARLAEAISDALQGRGAGDVVPMRQHITDVATRFLDGLRTRGEVLGWEIKNCGLLWHTMTTVEKAKWFLANRVCPWIGKAVRDQHRTANHLNYFLENYAPDARLSSLIELPPKLPSWATDDPFASMVVDYFVTPVAPLTHITFTTNLSADSLG